ncbi:hypothetical protein [Larsenimonas rhizosphaerae]|uniref:Uncharacterized protein n=1 Tax=Larsenimonas rhizosphaerae TaxID=2944682 RepID=A0AA41ZIG8_9GAMM|nr:hypothetical protein [Larsenimonas rhizosphaerae]MCX2525357.1 hypothetical protein [Larsenimonas rhizosphaerae]
MIARREAEVADEKTPRGVDHFAHRSAPAAALINASLYFSRRSSAHRLLSQAGNGTEDIKLG